MNIKIKRFLKKIWALLLASFNGFTNDRGLKLSASLAYYTVFSLAPMLILIISLTSFFYGKDAIEGQVFSQLKAFVGDTAAAQIQDIIKNLQLSGKTNIALIAGIVTLVVGATGIFLEIQDSINIIWRVKAKPKRGWVKMLKNRFLSFSLIISLGFLLMVSLIINGIIVALQTKLQYYFPDITILVVNGLNILVTFLVISFLFGIIFKFLPDVKISWKDVRTGAFFTAILFMIGRYGIGLYIESSGTTSVYGAAGSIIIILLWIYYTSAILYFGAEFTQVYAEQSGSRIEPADYAIHIEQIERKVDVDVLPPQNPQLKKDTK
ncbi:YihY/virulence factor BrkB family protein (plasmid) [Pedobacter sp. BS3]|uniref:YihY/virulence factor BrkB family protein n=1 Tax=Pedobacter sp. BS3 TaxID=2567937 RepID=UPI0011ED5AA2|nr:YihY/virulence factor BrkB family protein [Pedobacter sp. BS3]TZF85752.1 YihY/virulence factor BrkB family protein [Pedobacter sp. BS3]